MSARARSRVVRGFRLTTPYSVTTYCTSDRGVVTMVAGGKVGTIRLLGAPSEPTPTVEEKARKDLPPLASWAPRT